VAPISSSPYAIVEIEPLVPPQCCPTLSPDGQRVAFGDPSGTETKIYVQNSDGSDLKEVSSLIMTNGDGPFPDPVWSPDGQTLAFVDSNAYLYLIKADGANLTRLEPQGFDPAWSPDGTLLAYTSPDMDIYLMDIAGGQVRQLTAGEAGEQRPAWSPDGQSIAFVSDVDSNSHDVNYEIYIMNSDGSNQRRLTNNTAQDWGPVFSPDGRHIVFTSDRSGQNAIYVMNNDGADQRWLMDTEAKPRWRVDTTRVRFIDTLHTLTPELIATPTAPPPPTNTLTPVQNLPTSQCRVRADLLKLCTASSANLRSIWTSPYEHLLTSGVVFSALARSLDGAWLQVRLPKTAQAGWVSAGSPLMDCGNLNIAALPVAATVPDATCSPTPTTDIGVVASLSAIEPGSKDVTLQIEHADEGHTFFIDLFRLEITDNNGKRYTFDYGIPGNDGWRQQFSSDSLPYQLKGALTQPIDPTATQVTLSLQIDRAELGIPYVLIWQQALTPLAPATPVPAVVPPEGPVEAVFVSMPYLFLGQGASLVILDPTLDPAQPEVIGVATLPPATKISAIDMLDYYHPYAFVMADGLRIFDISNPTQPVQVGFYQPPPRDWAGYTTMTSPLPPPPRGMDVALQNTEAGRNYAYIAAWAAGLRIVDVTDPAAPVEVGAIEFEPATAVTGIALGWQIAYLSTTAGLRVVDVSDPTHPVQIAALPAVSWDVALAGGDFRLYLVEGQCSPLDGCVLGSLQAIDVSDPANPRLVEQVGLSYSQAVTLDDDVYTSAGEYNLYVATRDGLLVFRSSDLSRPAGQWPPDSSILIRDMAAIGDYLYLAARDDGLKILNVAEPTVPTEVGEIPASLRQPAGQPSATPLDEPTVGPEPTEEAQDNQ
jgi:WD40 repeat protein